VTEIRDAEIIIIGGGAIGCAVAYFLAKSGKTDVLVLEKEEALASATTALAAGLVGQVRLSAERAQLAMTSVATFDALEKAGEALPNWRQVGSLRVATVEERVAEFEQMKAVSDEVGLEVEIIGADKAGEMWPGMNFDQAKSILWCPSDGYVQPNDLVMSYHHHSRKMGIDFVTETMVEEIIVTNGRVSGVKTNHGQINCDTLINAAGSHAYHVALLADLHLPIIPIARYYFITEPIDGIRPDFPVLRFPDLASYARADVNALLTGGHGDIEPSLDPRSYSLSGQVPNFEDDWDAMASIGERMETVYPPLSEIGIRTVISGWPGFTPDGRFIIGESSRIKGFVMACGCNAHGVSAGFAELVLKSMNDKEPSAYVQSLSPDRYDGTNWSWETALEQAKDICNSYYSIGR
jgi:glycine/D-amino acid oxidase-like deaminating enzyme